MIKTGRLGLELPEIDTGLFNWGEGGDLDYLV